MRRKVADRGALAFQHVDDIIIQRLGSQDSLLSIKSTESVRSARSTARAVVTFSRVKAAEVHIARKQLSTQSPFSFRWVHPIVSYVFLSLEQEFLRLMSIRMSVKLV